MAQLKMYRIWYKDDSARLVNAADEATAREEAKELAELDAIDIKLAYQKAKGTNPDRAKELGKEYVNRTVVKRIECLTPAR